MISIMRRFFSFINIPRSKVCLIACLSVFEAFFAVSGVALLFPLIKFIELGPEAFKAQMTSGILKYFMVVLDALHLDVTMGTLILVAFLPIILQQVIRYFREACSIGLHHNVTSQLRKKVFNSLFSVDMDYYTKTKLGDIANALTTNSQRSGLVVQYLVSFWCSLLIALIFLGMLFVVSVRLTLISLGVLAAIYILTRKHTQILRNLSKTVESSNAQLHAYLIDRFRFVKRILLSNTSKEEEESFGEITEELETSVVKSLKVKALVNASLEPTFFLGALLILFISLTYLKIDIGMLILFMYVLSRLNPRVSNVINCRNQVLIYHRSFEKILDMYEGIKKETTIVNGDNKFEQLSKGIYFNNVDFSYTNEKTILDSTSLEFESNKTTALIGKSGAGKSTIIDLLLRFRDVKNGAIYVDDVDIKDLDIFSYRKKIGVLSQDVSFFHGTILENLTYGLEDLKEKEIKEACRMAHVDEFVEKLKKGYDTFLGESGARLSGGQKQRLALAHIFLQKPDIIILDEPTSDLDSESERVIKETFESLKGKKTIIIVAHRVSTIRGADKILVLDNGSIEEEGTYNELAQSEGVFRRMLELSEI